MAQNPYAPGSLDYEAYTRWQGGQFPSFERAYLAIHSVRPDLPPDPRGNQVRQAALPPTTPPIGSPEPPPRKLSSGADQRLPAPTAPPSVNTVPAGQTPGTRGSAPAPAANRAPAPTALPDRTYDKKGHASDGSQSVGLDNPWKIGAFEGGTYDHDTLATLAAIADGKQQGDLSAGEAAYILRQVGFQPDGQPNYEQRWAQSRKLDRYAQTPEAGGVSPWWHDPSNAPDNVKAQLGGGYRNEADAKANYGWWDQQDGRPNYDAAPPAQEAAPPPADQPQDQPPPDGEQGPPPDRMADQQQAPPPTPMPMQVEDNVRKFFSRY